jgi:hypothetical protein
MPLRKIQHAALFLLVFAAGAVGFEYRSNRRGPGPAPDELSLVRGRALLQKVLDAQDAESWNGRDTVQVRVDYRSPVRGRRLIGMILDVPSRSADFRDLRSPGVTYHLDGPTGALLPSAGALGHELGTIGPSCTWWIMVPRNLDDPDAVVWRLPDQRGAERPALRLAVRWSGEMEWFVLDIDPADATIHSIEFLDRRLPLFRWKGVPQGRTTVNGLTFFSSWRFSAANSVVRLLTGNREWIILEYGPLV